MHTTWIVVANSSNAHIYAHEGRDNTLQQVMTLSHPESRERTLDINADEDGRYKNRLGRAGNPNQVAQQGAGGGNLGAHQTPHRHEAEIFAHQIAHLLDEARMQNRYDSLIFVASPEFLGALNNDVNSHVSDMLIGTIDKDYTHYSEQQLLAALKPMLSS
jgi:protein required for attachment to host cells